MALFVFFSSCAVQDKIPNTNYRIYQKDSLVIHTELVSVPIPQERERIITDLQKSHLETSIAVSDAEIDSAGLLHHTLINKSDSIKTKIQYVDKIQIRDSLIIKEIPVEVEKEVRYIPKIYKYTFYICLVELIFIISMVIVRIRNGKIF